MKKNKDYIPISDIRKMSDEELIQLSQQRNSKNLLTVNAENAMRVRRERSGSAQWWGISRKSPSFAVMHERETGYSGRFNKKFR